MIGGLFAGFVMQGIGRKLTSIFSTIPYFMGLLVRCRAYERGVQGVQLKGPGKVQVAALSFGVAPKGVFRSAPNFGFWAKNGTKFDFR